MATQENLQRQIEEQYLQLLTQRAQLIEDRRKLDRRRNWMLALTLIILTWAMFFK